jgi:F-type H+-transporting ATPase subunit delta
VRQSIRGYADGVAERGDPARLGAELASVAAVVRGSDDLRRVLADPAVPAAARRGVVADLFGSRVGPDTARLLAFVVANGRPAETLNDFELLAARLGGTAPGEGILGHKAAEERVEGYATALLEQLGDRELGEVEDELFRFHRVVAGSEELLAALSSRDLPATARRAVVADLLAGKASATTTSLAAYATQVGRPRDYEALLEAMVARVAAETNRRLAEVRSAVELDETQTVNLAAALGRTVGHEVEVRVTVDPSVVAGFVATIGDIVVDGSARHQLEVLRERLTTPEAFTTGERRQWRN